MILADALSLADEEKPEMILDMATLTGAARTALGPDLPPLYSTDDGLAAELAAAGAPYIAGDAFTIADIPVGLVVNRWYGVDFDKPVLPAVARYYEWLSERPGYRLYGRNGTP